MIAAEPTALRVGFEFTAENHDHPEHRSTAFMDALVLRGFTEIGTMTVVDPETGALFKLGVDMGHVVEVGTPPLYLPQVKRVLRPLYETARSEGLTFESGGTHMHIDGSIVANDPIRLVNFFIEMHNEPLLSKLFISEHFIEPTFVEKYQQQKFLEMIEEFSQSESKDWDAVAEILLSNRLMALDGLGRGMLLFKADSRTLEIRAIGSTQNENEAYDIMRFFEAVWNSLSSDRLIEPVQWDIVAYNQSLSESRFQSRKFLELMSRYGLSADDYKPYFLNFVRARKLFQEDEVISDIFKTTSERGLESLFGADLANGRWGDILLLSEDRSKYINEKIREWKTLDRPFPLPKSETLIEAVRATPMDPGPHYFPDSYRKYIGLSPQGCRQYLSGPLRTD